MSVPVHFRHTQVFSYTLLFCGIFVESFAQSPEKPLRKREHSTIPGGGFNNLHGVKPEHLTATFSNNPFGTLIEIFSTVFCGSTHISREGVVSTEVFITLILELGLELSFFCPTSHEMETDMFQKFFFILKVSDSICLNWTFRSIVFSRLDLKKISAKGRFQHPSTVGMNLRSRHTIFQHIQHNQVDSFRR